MNKVIKISMATTPVKSGTVVDINHRPPPHCFYGDSYERGLDPFHADAFIGTPAAGCGSNGKRAAGWFLLDAWGNQIGFYPDGIY